MDVSSMAIVTVIATSLPLAMAVGVVYWQSRQSRLLLQQDESDGSAAQLPAERQRKRIEARSDRIEWLTVQMLLVGMVAWIAVVASQIAWDALRLTWIDGVILVIAMAWTVLTLRQLSVLWEERRGGGDGVRAEVAVARRLDGLQAQGWQVLHEIPVADFDIDHVVVGQSAVFALETKARRYGRANGGTEVRFDGQTLHFPTWSETRPLEQARVQGRWLAEHLEKTLGQAVPVVSVLCLPGWKVLQEAGADSGDVRVIAPADAAIEFSRTRDRPAFDADQRRRIGQAIHALYRIDEPSPR
ncbi:nuclease-related domain-containing protein [Thermomonas sp.]|uniref:nuclease-related domain-containing protein n=1 Tax=Thermomonas sp. TaxID=1971895 RepID=UPI00260BC25E|nr:nuclease-related domain-containing protein [Thermomonas sp.]